MEILDKVTYIGTRYSIGKEEVGIILSLNKECYNVSFDSGYVFSCYENELRAAGNG